MVGNEASRAGTAAGAHSLLFDERWTGKEAQLALMIGVPIGYAADRIDAGKERIDHIGIEVSSRCCLQFVEDL